ncbi:MAG TPA: ferritin family protein [Candidatus Margulisiibacteriota bacterium]|nr:ferritin family protein [Candidatus Margulisiibacteriota bacterium]
MGNIFSGSEIVELGIEIEKNGRDFYDSCLKSSSNEKLRKLFKYLALEEEKHIEVFKKILASVNAYEPAESYPGEYLAYMRALSSEQVFTQKDKGKEIAAKVKSDKETVDLAIGFEKDSIIFYEGMMRFVPQDDHRLVDQLIAQEQGHLRQLVDLKSTL